MAGAQSSVTTVLVTDLVGSTALLQNVGDESAQRLFLAHQKLLQDIITSNGGRDSKWMGDGMLTVFHSASDAVRCAIRMQQAAERPIGGHKLAIRVGLHCGEVTKRDEDYFGTTVELADSICNSGQGGQILCSSLVAELLFGRQAFAFRDSGETVGKNGDAVALYEVEYEVDRPAVLLDRPPFTGREAEFEELERAFRAAVEGAGGVVLLAGEPGIGKSRLIQELAETAQAEGATVLGGQCYEGDWTPPYGPFAEALAGYVRDAHADELHRDMGSGATAIAQVAPALRDKLPELADPEPLRPEEERFRLFDAVAQFLRARSLEAPTILVLDDLHWADGDSISLLRHVARLTAHSRLLIVGAYRDVELDRKHPLADALAALRRDTGYHRIALRGLEGADVRALLAMLSEEPPPEALVSALARETYGNPYFLREVLLHLVEASQLYRDGEWVDPDRVKELGIPESVRQVIGRRLSRLSDDANRLLSAVSAFRGTFPFDLAMLVCSLPELAALDALDEGLNAQLLRPASEPDHYLFSHALIRDTLYGEMNPSRQVRLHRQIATTMEQTYGDRATDHAAELAYQYYQSAAVPGSEPGASYALVAADRAEAAYAYEELATFVRMALELLPEDHAERPRLLGRMGLARAWALEFADALAVMKDAGEAIATFEGEEEAAAYLAEAAKTMARAGFLPGAWELASRGLARVGEQRNETWAWLMSLELMRREAQDSEQPGIPLDTPERQEVARATAHLPYSERPPFATPFTCRDEVLELAWDEPLSLTYLAGAYRRSVELLTERSVQYEQQGRVARAVTDWSLLARCHTTLGDFDAAWAAYEKAASLAERLPGPSPQALQLFSTRLELQFTIALETAEPLSEAQPFLQQPAANLSYAAAPIRAVAAVGYAWLGQTSEALRWLESLLPALTRAPAWAPNYTVMANLAAYVLWLLECTDHLDVIEQQLQKKVVEPDFRFPMQDGRLSMARLCAVRAAPDEAHKWFDRARHVLDEEGARPLRAITDLNEAEMHIRAGVAPDADPVASLLRAAIGGFRALGMPGWVRYAETLDA